MILTLFLPSTQEPENENAINKLESIEFKKEENSFYKCVICTDDFVNGVQVIQFTCPSKHIFHTDCLKKWLSVHAICPLCKYALNNH